MHPWRGGDAWHGIAHTLPTRRRTLDLRDATPEQIAEIDREDAARPLFEWMDGVRFMDNATGIVFEVIPSEGNAPRHYSETAIRDALPVDPPPLSRRWLNARARLFLADHKRAAVDAFAERPTWDNETDTPKTRPDDGTLVMLVLAAYSTGQSPRQTLAAEFGVSTNTADDWIKRARRVAPEHGETIPAPTRGRGHGQAKGAEQ